MKGKKTVFCGDIGCYTLGNALPLDMVDTCLCMGAGLNIAQGIEKWNLTPHALRLSETRPSSPLRSQVLSMPCTIRRI